MPLPRQKSKDLYVRLLVAVTGQRQGASSVNRQFTHWNTDPWQLDYGGNGGGWVPERSSSFLLSGPDGRLHLQDRDPSGSGIRASWKQR